MRLFVDEAHEAELQREYDTENAPKVAALERLVLSNAIELPRPRESWVARDLRWVYEQAQRVFGIGA